MVSAATGGPHADRSGGADRPGPATRPDLRAVWSPEPGDVVGDRYELGPVVGRGGSSTVFEAHDCDDDRPVAVKMFAAGVDGPGAYRQDQEITTLARLSHPGLVELFDAGQDRGRSYLVIALVRGPSLDERMRAGAMPTGRVVTLGARLGEALSYVHGQGVTHRDLKPANVLLDGDRPLLADFGIALLVDETRVTAVDALIGTAAYMAPEQLRGEPIGPPADVYALGLVLIEALSGQRAFPGTSAEAVVGRLHHGPAVPADLPAGLTSLLTAMTDDGPARRPSAAGVAAALRVVGGESDGDRTAPGAALGPIVVAGSRTRRWTRPRLAAAGVAGAVLVGGLVGASMVSGAATSAGGVVESPLAAAALPPPALLRAPAAAAPTLPTPARRAAEVPATASGVGAGGATGRPTPVTTRPPSVAATGSSETASRPAPPSRAAGSSQPEADSDGGGRERWDDRDEQRADSSEEGSGTSGGHDENDGGGDEGGEFHTGDTGDTTSDEGGNRSAHDERGRYGDENGGDESGGSAREKGGDESGGSGDDRDAVDAGDGGDAGGRGNGDERDR